MEFVVNTIAQKKDYTISKMFIDGEYFCDVLEDTVRSGPKVWGQTAIPAGTYKMILSMSPRFGRILPRILNVPGFDGILIHGGNTAEDTHGCLLVGINEEKGKVLKSQITLAKLLALLQNSGEHEFTIKINRK